MDWEAFTVSGVTSYTALGVTVAGYALLFLVIWATCLLALISAGYPQTIGKAPRRTWALTAPRLIHHTFVGPLALYAMFEDPALREALTCVGCSTVAQKLVRDAAAGPCRPALALVPITIGYMGADLLLLPAWDKAKGKAGKIEAILLVLHHTISIVVWPFALHYDYCSRYVLVLCYYEVSSIFLTIMGILSHANYQDNMIYRVNGLVFTVSFVFVRLLTAIPQLRALWYAPPWTYEVKYAVLPDEPFQLWQRLATCMILVPHVLNFFWGYKVITGFARGLCAFLGKKMEGSDTAASASSIMEGSCSEEESDHLVG
jgi:hypothetical protein